MVSWFLDGCRRRVCLFVGDKMIAEEKKDLVDRREFYQAVTRRMEREGGANLSTTLTLREIVEIFKEIPAHDELSAEWVKENDKWVCTWCRMDFHVSYTTKYCPYCGRRMKIRMGER